MILKWMLNNKYYKEDIIYYNNNYYICTKDHTNSGFINPELNEEYYWVYIDIEDLQNHISELKIQENKSNNCNKLKRKINNIDIEIEKIKKCKLGDGENIIDKIKLLDIDIKTKIFILEKYKNLNPNNQHDYSKGITWINNILNIPFGNYKNKNLKISNKIKIKEYLTEVRQSFDNKICNMEYVKDEIIEFLARKISNPNSKGEILALCGSPGVGKTRLLKSLGDALKLPFHQINLGGMNDVSILTGHSETYVGSKCGKIVEILQKSECMNPIIYLDEMDKIANNKAQEIYGVLTHILDEEQNDKYQDNYLSNINIDLSKVLFVISFNDISKINRIVKDRLKIINVKDLTINDKINIIQTKIMKELYETFKINKNINISKELLKYIIENKVEDENGIRSLKKAIEKIFSKFNLLLLTDNYKDKKQYFSIYEDFIENKKVSIINIKKEFIDYCLINNINDNKSYNFMYI